jgi:hypothetical protein
MLAGRFQRRAMNGVFCPPDGAMAGAGAKVLGFYKNQARQFRPMRADGSA